VRAFWAQTWRRAKQLGSTPGDVPTATLAAALKPQYDEWRKKRTKPAEAKKARRRKKRPKRPPPAQIAEAGHPEGLVELVDRSDRFDRRRSPPKLADIEVVGTATCASSRPATPTSCWSRRGPARQHTNNAIERDEGLVADLKLRPGALRVSAVTAE